ncbi:hypothetical protein M409DRAFT_50966 [Zasmidium cellare ATCC 36951]|uniref:F-box domain-containing protein n=1 Tax=Zasmidium cellare ATCC 36951 TaxID=1080233 RepID=A0A6A6CWZ1_ZASCE|nr:uncharacterized protein M409DRAFT_50966 [Zasmidium cellare ATCC 36951]KAF2171545.1 hypothetical protein M409DRAFT_50966 [Zasmidium cellare ATCC 36951]
MESTPSSLLLSLPAELRNRIWHEILLPQSDDSFRLTNDHMEPSLLCANRQVRLEAIGIFYSNNKLHFSDPQTCVRRLTSIPSEYVALIPELQYDTTETCEQGTSWRTAFRGLPGLEQETKMRDLKEEMSKHGVELRAGVLKCRILLSNGPVWTTHPMNASLEAADNGMMVCRMMFF